MVPLKINIACGAYDRTQALIDRTIRPEGIELRCFAMPHGEMWQQILNDSDIQVSELSLAWHVIARSLGKPLLAIPVFPARAFRHSYIFINTKSGIHEPRDLMGKKVGLGEFPQTAAVIARAILQHEYGVSLEKIKWFTWGKQSLELKLSERYEVHSLQTGKSPDRLLIDGDLDALILSSLFPSFARGAPNVRRLFENYQEVETAYFKKTGIFPIMHTVVIERIYGKSIPGSRRVFTKLSKSRSKWLTRSSTIFHRISSAWFGSGNRWRSSSRCWGRIPGATVSRKTATPWRCSSAISTSRN